MTPYEKVQRSIELAQALIAATYHSRDFKAREVMAVGALERVVKDAITTMGGGAHHDVEPIRVALRDVILYVHHNVGAPGDWGYETAEGEALSKLYRAPVFKDGDE